MSHIRGAVLFLTACVLLAGCASSSQKTRKEQRDKVMQSSKMFCEFINGEQYPDIDVALNLQMAQRCDAEKSFSITSYKTPSEIPGVLFCCAIAQKQPAKLESPVGKSVEKPAAKAAPSTEPSKEKEAEKSTDRVE